MSNNNNKILTIAEWVIVGIAYAYLIYKLCKVDNYSTILHSFKQAGIEECICLVICVLLMPVNLLLESCKWREVLKNIYTLSYKNAFVQVLYGMVGAFITPYRAGDIPSRVLLLQEKKNWEAAILLGFYGGIIQTIVIVGVGIIPVYLFLQAKVSQYIYWLLVAMVIVVGFIVILRKIHLPDYLRLTYSQKVNILLWSILRYLCWLIQFVLLLRWADIHLSFRELCLALPTYYLFIAITPNIPIADAGIRGSWAIYILGGFNISAPIAAIMAICMWIINTLLPIFCYVPFRLLLHKQNGRNNKGE